MCVCFHYCILSSLPHYLPPPPPSQWMMLSLTNPPFTSRESTDFADRAFSSPQRSLSAGAYRLSPKFVASASVRLSPFPSPTAGDTRSAFSSPGPKVLGGAFTPYKRPVLKRPPNSPVMRNIYIHNLV